MERKLLYRLACVAGLIYSFGAVGCSGSKAEDVQTPTPVVKQESPYSLRSSEQNGFKITRMNREYFMITDIAGFMVQYNLTVPNAIEQMRKMGCDIKSDSISRISDKNFQVEVTNPDDCLPNLK